MSVWTYSLKRLISIPPTIVIILLIVFLIFSYIGNASPVSSQFPSYNPAIVSFLSAFVKFLAQILTGNWGYLGALKGQPTFSGQLTTLVSIYFYATLEIILIAAPIALLISFPMGRYLGTHASFRFPKAVRTLVAAAYLTPAYVVGLLLQVFFGQGTVKGNPLGIFPIEGAFDASALPVNPPSWLQNQGVLVSQPTHMLLFDSLIHGDYALAYNLLLHLVLPIFTLVITISAVVIFLLESGYVDNMGMEYVRSARSRGVPEKLIVKKHVRKNAVLPVMASTTIMVAYMTSNIIMMEYVFAYPGIGMFLITTMLHGQYYPTAVIVFLLGLLIVAMGISIDILNYIKNPLARL